MTIRWQQKTLALCVSAALAQLAVGSARADSAVGVNTILGNALNPNTLKTIPTRDPEVLDAVPDERTPTGKLIGWPAVVPEIKTTASGWKYYGEAELGWMGAGGDTGSWWYNQYKDLPTNGLYLNNFYFQADQLEKGKGYFIEALGGGVGYRDQYEGVNFGRYNDWKVKLFYTEIPHTFTSTYRSLWSGVGSDNLTLNTLTPGGTRLPADPRVVPNGPLSTAATRTNLVNAINAIEDSELSLLRETGGLTFDKYITNTWRFYGSYTKERRTGARPFGAVFGGGGGGGDVEIPESIDYDTQDILAALRYDDGVNNFNLQANVSLFRNNIDTLTFQNPLYTITNTIAPAPAAPGQPANILDPTQFTAGRFDLYPDNNYYNLRAEYARSMPDWYHSRLTATASFSKYKQDDDLIAPSMYSLNGLAVNGVPAANMWNTTAALSKQSADAEIDTQLFDIGLVMRPTEKLDVNGKIRYYATDNKTEYFACNPQTGQWGRLLNDGTGGAFVVPSPLLNANPALGNNPVGTLPTAYNTTGCDLAATQALGLVPNAGNVNIRNVPFQYSKLNFELGGEYRVAKGQTINAKLEREEYQRDYREREETWENMIKLGYVNRAFKFGTLRASAEYGSRRGDDYNPDPYHQFYSASLGPEPTAATTAAASWVHAMGSFRKYDVADRDRLALDLRMDLIALHDLDVGITGQYRDIEYPDSDFGRTDNQTLGSATLDVNWQPSAKLGITGWYTYQQSSLSQSAIAPNNCNIGSYYFFYSDGFVGTVAGVLGGAPPVAPVRRGATVVNTTYVAPGNAANWQSQCDDHSPTSPLWPDSRTWEADTEDSNSAFGLAARYDMGFVRLELDGTYITGTTSVNYNYNQDALAGANDPKNPLTPAVNVAANSAIWQYAGTGMPDQDYNQQIINFNIVFPINKSVAIRALYRYEQGSIDDWHYAGVDANPVPSFNAVNAAGVQAQAAQAVYLDSGPQDYHTNTIGLLVQVNF